MCRSRIYDAVTLYNYAGECIKIYIYMYCIIICIFIYLNIQMERERERSSHAQRVNASGDGVWVPR